jgi:hypothetical protein
MKEVLSRAGVTWAGWHAFRRGLASNLNRLGVDDSIIQSILRHSTVSVTQNHYIKTARPDAIAAIKVSSSSNKVTTMTEPQRRQSGKPPWHPAPCDSAGLRLASTARKRTNEQVYRLRIMFRCSCNKSNVAARIGRLSQQQGGKQSAGGGK